MSRLFDLVSQHGNANEGNRIMIVCLTDLRRGPSSAEEAANRNASGQLIHDEERLLWKKEKKSWEV